MSLNVGSVWLKQADGQEVQISANDVKLDDQLVIHMGTVIPFDGTVVAGEAMVNQASLTGESVAVQESRGQFRLCRNRCGRGRADDPSEICGRQQPL